MIANISADDGIIVIMNGPSASGKSSIQRALQTESKRHFLRIGIDTFFDALIEEPDLTHFQEEKKFDQYTPSGEYIRGVELSEDSDKNPIVTLKIGPAGDRIIHGMHRAIRAYAESGNDVIVDYILYKEEWLPDLQSALDGLQVYYVGVNAPLEVIEEREKKRSTSPAGHARSHYDTVHKGMVYDIEVDTAKNTPEMSAHKILEMITPPKAP